MGCGDIKSLDQYFHVTRVRGVLSGSTFNRTSTGNLFDGFVSFMETYNSATLNDTGLVWTCPKDGWYNVQISGHTVDSATSGRLDFILTVAAGASYEIEVTDYTVAEASPAQLDRSIFSEIMKFSAGQTLAPSHHSASVRKFGFINYMISYVTQL